MKKTLSVLRVDGFDVVDVTLDEAAVVVKDGLLADADFIVAVASDSDNQAALGVLRRIKELTGSVEETRKAIKAPVLDLSRKIDGVAKEFVDKLLRESDRISKLIGGYQSALLAKEREERAIRDREIARLAAERNAERLRIEEQAKANLARIEEEKRAQLVEAASDADASRIERGANTALVATMLAAKDARVAVDAQFRSDVATTVPRVEVAKPIAGQFVREDWEIEVVDAYALAREHPGAVNILPRISAIKDLLDAGKTVAGVKAKRVARVVVQK